MAKKAQSGDPDKLVREQAGTYRTADGRFEARESGTGWFLVDTAQSNEFGQELVLGPYNTLKAVREAIPEARAKPMRPAPKPPKAPKPKKGRAAPAEEPAPPPPPTWIDRLSKADATAVRNRIRALEQAGLDDAEAVVRRDLEGLSPVVAARLIERRLATLVDEAADTDLARAVVAEVVGILEGERPKGDLPGWSLVEIGPEPEPPNRRIQIDLPDGER